MRTVLDQIAHQRGFDLSGLLLLDTSSSGRGAARGAGRIDGKYAAGLLAAQKIGVRSDLECAAAFDATEMIDDGSCHLGLEAPPA